MLDSQEGENLFAWCMTHAQQIEKESMKEEGQIKQKIDLRIKKNKSDAH